MNRTVYFVLVIVIGIMIFTGYATTGGNLVQQTAFAEQIGCLVWPGELYGAADAPRIISNDMLLMGYVTEEGVIKLARLKQQLTKEDCLQFGKYMMKASESDIKELAKRLNTTAVGDFKARWWE